MLNTAVTKIRKILSSQMLKLNVGGQIFATTLETLQKDPDSILHGMVSGKPSEDGSYFIDRDGTHFRYILNYLRTGELDVPEDKSVRRELLAEAEFYHVQGIIKVLSRFKDSVILSSDQGQTLINWLMETRAFTNASEKLLYRASRDGWAAANFHSCCDNKGPTVTVIKSGNYIFGGYTEENWDCSGVWKKAPDSFLFSLVNPCGLPPTKMLLIPGQEKYAIQCQDGCGPIFGIGLDLCTDHSRTLNQCFLCLSGSYKCPTDEGQNAGPLKTGKQEFIISEMEVFGFEQ